MNSPEQKKSRRTVTLWVAIIAAVGALPILVFTLPVVLGKYQLENVRKELAARGETVDALAFQPPSVRPEDDYFSMEYFRLSERWETISPSVNGLKADLAKIKSKISELQTASAFAGEPLNWDKLSIESVEASADASQRIAKLTEILTQWEALRNDAISAIAKTGADAKFKTKDGMSAKIPFAGICIRLLQLLQWHCLVALEKGKADEAYEDVLAIARLAEAFRSIPGAMGLMLTDTNWSSVRLMIWNGMRTWSPEQLANLRELAKKSSPQFSDQARSLRAERALLNRTFEDHEAHAKLKEIMNFSSGSPVPWWSSLVVHATWANCMASMQEYIDCYEKPRPSPGDFLALDAKLASYKGIERAAHLLESLILQANTNPYKVFRGQDEARMTEIAIALELWRRKNGSYPEKLTDLVPDYLPDIPVGSIPGQTFQYRRFNAGYLIWSNGWNGTDEGGKFEKYNERNGDWILRAGEQK